MIVHPMPAVAEVFSALYDGNVKSFNMSLPEDDIGVGDQVVLRENDGTSYTGRWLTLDVKHRSGAEVSVEVIRRGP